ncbi:hypothetical protein SAMN05421676_105181 [Salinibacillus kushneri]|uniref:Uncharacterized protein n=1 Tax=Salinibacillus kushneri TaxID=237682 RepID=A0A1I0F3L4_9BACI|nr:hypothetical protein [Salinibacillus kushneri]SET52417.1 hypothetical protein SAMN05421676_105181 [Salinibacillus kushneri]
MDFKEAKRSFILIDFRSAGKWNGSMICPLPKLWHNVYQYVRETNEDKIVRICLHFKVTIITIFVILK